MFHTKFISTKIGIINNNKGLNYSLELPDGNFRNYLNKSEKKMAHFYINRNV